MTVKEFYEYAIANGIENYNIEIQYRDGGGCYCGSESACIDDAEIDHLRKEITI